MALSVAAAAGVLAWQGLLPEGYGLAALAGVAAVGLADALLALFSRNGSAVGLVLWGMAGAGAGLLTGGAAGPLAAWSLLPVAAAAISGQARLLAPGAALGVAGVAALALAPALGLWLPPVTDPGVSPWLSLLSLGTVGLSFSAGLVALQGVTRADRSRSGRRARDLTEALGAQPQLLLSLSAEGKILAGWGDASGRNPADLVGQRFEDLAQADDRAALKAAFDAADSRAEVGFAPAHDPAAWRIVTLRPAGGSRTLAAIRDASRQRDREAELEQGRSEAQAQNAGKSRFLANMSHELRTPLNAIMGFSDIMRQRLFGPMADRYADYAQLIHESGAHLLELINDVLDMSKIEAERFELAREEFDAREAITAVLRLMRGQADRAGINLRGLLPPEPLPADADRRAVKQIALNLLSNAMKFTPRGGSVTLTVQARGRVLELVVADTGIGIAPDDLARLGRPFEQAGDAEQRAAGSGLGLSLVRAFAGLHGGDMSVESVVGEGTAVTVRLPVLLEQAAPGLVLVR